MARSALTWLVLLPDRLVRWDPPARPASSDEVMFQTTPRPPTEDLARLVKTALGESPPGRQVLVLAAELPLRSVTLPEAAITDTGELEAALAFELGDALDLIPGAAGVGHVEVESLAGERSFLVSALEHTTLERLRDAIESEGATLLGLAPAAGLPVALGAGQESEDRIELWPDLAVRVRCEAGVVRRTVSQGDPRAELWPADFGLESGSDEDAGGAERVYLEAAPQLLGPAFAAPEAGSPPAIRSLTDNATLSVWLRAAHSLIRDPTELPLIKPTSRPLSTRALQAFGALALVLIAAACFAHDRFLRREIAALNAVIDEAGEPIRRRSALTKSIKALTKQLGDLRAREIELAATVESREQGARKRRVRLARLLAGLARSVDSGTEIASLDGDAETLVVHGRSAHAAGPGKLARGLARDLAGLGWQIRPAHTRYVAAPELEAGGYWAFSIHLRDELPMPKARPVKPAAKGESP